ncbi:alpha/beta hydrolase family protein [Aliikangiella coralliicola]|uniref:Alpha/beta hydrolase n=1 Tax=Aliikangiella coralliicola TaxID=2592383 RepID=A0A545UC76_9GAMM|nr:alpha/beta fold hydrolase [Aliikangiella coralliicola]TQV87066.1 alpha/beta hydrolase [Aliikangiella coralliicola]
MKKAKSFFSIIMLLIAALLYGSSSVLAKGFEGDWEGDLKLPGGVLPIVIHIKTEGGKQVGTLDTPSQGGFDIPMTLVEFNEKELTFEIEDLSIHYSGKLNSETDQIKGNFFQKGMQKLNFSRIVKKPLPADGSSNSEDLLGQWYGPIKIPGNPLDFVVHVKQQQGSLVAVADSPNQESYGIEIDSISLEKGQVKFEIKKLGVKFVGMLAKNKQSIKGDFAQSGFIFKLKMVKGQYKKKVSSRPQTPKKPFDYHIEEVLVTNNKADLVLAGTLTKPKSNKVKATAVLISGSGPQDRDETIVNHKPFWVIADILTKADFAVLRLDDRGTGKSTGDFDSATSEDFVTDAGAAVDFLLSRDDIPADTIGLIGHSEGGMIAPMLAAQRDDVAFVIMLAGPGIPNAELLAEQHYLLGLAQGISADVLKQKQDVDKQLFALIGATEKKLASEPQIVNLIEKSLRLVGVNDEKILEQQKEQLIQTYGTGWFRYFLSYSPAEKLAKVKAPILAINGSNDLQVAAKSNLDGIRNALKSANHSDFTVVELPQLNHLFQTSKTGSPVEYAIIEETFSPVASKLIVDWLEERF